MLGSWTRDLGARVDGSRDLDSAKLQAPCIVRLTGGGYRLFYTAVGPGKPYPNCQGYILSAVSDDGVNFEKEEGIRLAPEPDVPYRSLRLLAPSVTEYASGKWRMYIEARGPADRPTVITSALSSNLIDWEHEEGIRLGAAARLGGPRYLKLPDGRGRLYCFGSDAEGREGVVSAITADGVSFELEPGLRLKAKQSELDSCGITAAEVIAPKTPDDPWTMVYSAWQDAPPGTEVPLHPAHDPNAEADGMSADFAAASIAADMAGFRSRIFIAHSSDGLSWKRAGCVVEGAGYGEEGIDAVHAEDMSLVELDGGAYRMYYAACDTHGNWRIASTLGQP